MKEETGVFSGSGGLSLFYRGWGQGGPKGVLAVVHGLGEHSGRYQNLARYFSPRGYSLYALDLRGHGRSGGRRADAASWEELEGDLDLFIERVSRREGRRPFLLGHSFGGQVVINYLRSERRLPGVILSSPNIRVAVPVPRWKELAAKLLSQSLPALALGNPEMISRDPEVVKAYREDPLIVRKITTRLGSLILKNQEGIMALASKFRLASLLMHGGGDRLTSPEATREFFEKIPVEEKTLKIYDGFYHELFNEIGKERVFRDMEGWLEKHL